MYRWSCEPAFVVQVERESTHKVSLPQNNLSVYLCGLVFLGVFLYLRICVFVYIHICIKIYRYLYIYLVQVVERAQIRQVIRNKACLCRPTFTHSFLFLFWQILWLHISFLSWFDTSINFMQRNQKDDKPKTDQNYSNSHQ